MNRFVASFKGAARNLGGGYGDLCVRYALPVLLTAGVVGILGALVHATPGRWLLFAGEMFVGAAIVQVILWYPGRADIPPCDCTESHDEESA